MTQSWKDPSTRDFHFMVQHSELMQLINDRTERTVAVMIADEIERSIRADEDMRILVKQMVQEAVAKVDLNAIVSKAAVAFFLDIAKGKE